MSFSLNPVQQAVYDVLNGAIAGVAVYDDVPDLPAKLPDTDFPYIHIGEDLASAWDTDDTVGNSVTLTLYVWSRSSGKKQVKQIMCQIYTLLNRQYATFSAPGVRFVDCLFEFAQVLDMDDGKTRQGICRYRVTIEKE